MGYRKIEILRSYRTNKCDVVQDFYIPALKQSVLYKRAVGFFSSGALIQLSHGISSLIKNGGKIKFIVSPLLSEEDIQAIQNGYDCREIVKNSLEREFHEPQNYSEEERLNWLAFLIASGRMEIKVAFMSPQKANGIYHEKIGLLYDEDGERLAFTGSMNETINAFHNNYESIVVFNSLVAADVQRIVDIERDFDALWADREPNVRVWDFPKALQEKILSYKKDTLDLTLDSIELEGNSGNTHRTPGTPTLPRNVVLHEYQESAIEQWVKQGFRGIFDMATGTGKTFTGLGAVVRLFEEKRRAAVIIVCPYQHLVEQWVEDILQFNMRPTIGYSASKQADWKTRLSNDVIDFRLKVIDFFCFVTTNATYASAFVQNELNKLGKDTLLLVDEAHNFGAANLRTTLNPKFEYRLALSATLERYGDPEGTKVLYDYFGEKCIEYTLEQAIRENKLTPYYYYPKPVFLTADELEKYRELSKRIVKQCRKGKSGSFEITELGKKLLLERARLIAGATNKVALLRELMEGYRDKDHILVYCGAARSLDAIDDESVTDEIGERQIVSVSKMLGHELHMKVIHFTSMESAAEREKIKQQFAEADPYQAIVAIKCLDEGVNIPSIQTAFILASSTNPKEYIQRRGRVLRKAPYKPFAVIYDFITLPTPLEYVDQTSDTIRLDLSLVKKEILRMKEFGKIAQNPSEADRLINELTEVYGLDTISEEEYFDE